MSEQTGDSASTQPTPAGDGHAGVGGSGSLADGGTPAGPDALFAKLDTLGIQTETKRHDPVFTVEEAKQLRGELSGGHTKNLFLRNKKGRMWLVVCLEDREIDLKALGEQLESGRLSFGSADRLMSYLGVVPGAVTPFAALNDSMGKVQVMLDRGMLRDHERLNFHPLDNAMTTGIAPDDLVRFLNAVDHAPDYLDLT
ncbi:prolyl-tRNA synthetase associated domain-containing protein [Rhodovibrio salinarum]|uniref:Prolyl-tRNA synthetase associated domain-containing protein n=1 Tax=Rhodovibrio salinarum TaxID=1087 RepID=A0A934QH78_9PROT|nr:prolyl-tRNA synthetase associated domain-containing protein [Rhodovibrio salinarum]MBK1696951.1 prolyl-tRNA synthetase associated domain-containing protein [Rhodovibrio salinarum]